MTPEPTGPKPGIKTTEFWTMAIATFGTAILAAVAGHPWAAGVLAAGAVALPAAYIWGRSILKAERSGQTNVIPDQWEPMIERLLDLTEALAKAIPTGAGEDPPADAVGDPPPA